MGSDQDNKPGPDPEDTPRSNEYGPDGPEPGWEPKEPPSGLFGTMTPARAAMTLEAGPLIAAYLLINALWAAMARYDSTALLAMDFEALVPFGLSLVQAFCALALGILVFRRGGLPEVLILGGWGIAFGVYLLVLGFMGFGLGVFSWIIAAVMVLVGAQVIRARLYLRRHMDEYYPPV